VNTSRLAERRTYEAEALALHEAIPGHHTQTMLAGENAEIPPFRRFMDDRRYSEVGGRFMSFEGRPATPGHPQNCVHVLLEPTTPRAPPARCSRLPPPTHRYYFGYAAPSQAPGRYPIDGAFIEGWGLYSESLGKDLGCYTDPFQMVGRLSAEIFRSCRLVVDTGIHAQGWTIDRAKAFMLCHTAANEGNVDAEVKRYATWPGQAVGYKMGELELWRLRRRYASALGGGFDVKNFHDLVLLNGSLPLYVIEELMEEDIKKRTSPQAATPLPAAPAAPAAAAASPGAGKGETELAPDLAAARAFGFGLGLGLGIVLIGAVIGVSLAKPRP
jgi:hypothetical protein